MMAWAKGIYLGLRANLLRPFYPPAAEVVDLGSVRTILVLRYDRIGDMVHTTPLLAALRQEFPDAEISVLASQDNAPVLQGNPHVKNVYVLPLRGRNAFIDQLNRHPFDLLIDTYLSYDWAWTRIAARIVARYRLCLDLYGRGIFYNIRVPAPLPPLRACEAILEIGRIGLNRPLRSQEPKVYLEEGEVQWGRKKLSESGLNPDRRMILLHPGGHYPEQRWPTERFAQVAVALDGAEGCEAALVGGPRDEPLLARAACFEPSVKILSVDSLRQLIAILSCARLLICNNSGPLHLACALAIPTLSTLGPTDRTLWAPQGLEHQILERNPLENLYVDEVLREALALLKRPVSGVVRKKT